MPRIRTIKPEFAHSESMGRVTREARLLFILMWTAADDEGRLKAHPKSLSGSLFPYDDDACAKIEGWLDELVKEGCVRRYSADGNLYAQITKWSKHQLISHRSPSKIPAPEEEIRKALENSGENPDDSGPTARQRESSLLGPPPSPLPSRLDSSERDRVDVDGVVADWNAMAARAGLSTITKVTPDRRRKIIARTRDAGSREALAAVFERVGASSFCRGEKSTNGHSGWRADLDFVLREPIFVKIQEGRYDDGPRTNGNGHASGPATVMAKGFANALAKRNGNSATDHASPVVLLDGERGRSVENSPSRALVK